MKRRSPSSTPERGRRTSGSIGPSPNKKPKVRPDEEAENWTIDRLFSLGRPRNLNGIELPDISHARLLIDTREQWKDDVKGNLKALGVDSDFKSLECGDYLWVGDKYSFDCCIERKTVDDLRKSLVDGRFERQNENMRKYKMNNLFYLVEGDEDIEEYLERIRREGFKIIRSRNINETFWFLYETTRDLNEYIKNEVDYKKLFFTLDDAKYGRRGPFINYREKSK